MDVSVSREQHNLKEEYTTHEHRGCAALVWRHTRGVHELYILLSDCVARGIRIRPSRQPHRVTADSRPDAHRGPACRACLAAVPGVFLAFAYHSRASLETACGRRSGLEHS